MRKTAKLLVLIALLFCIGSCFIGCGEKSEHEFECEHEFEDTKVEATCMSYGYTEHKCTLCGKTEKTDCGTTYADHKGVDNCTVCGKSIWGMLFNYLKKEGDYSESLGYYFLDIYSDLTLGFSMKNEDKVSLFVQSSNASLVTSFDKGKLSDGFYLFKYDSYQMYGEINLATFSKYSTYLKYDYTTFPSSAISSASKTACSMLQVGYSGAALYLSTGGLGINLSNLGIYY